MDNILVYIITFFLYCIIGWIWESIYMSFLEKRIQNRGYLKGPYIPIYGVAGMVVSLVLGRFYGPLLSKSTIIIYVVGMVFVTTIELITATLAEKILHRALWDYTIYKFNYKGRICLLVSLFWGLVCVLFVQLFNPTLNHVITSFSHDAKVVVATSIATLMFVDALVTSVKQSPLPGIFDKKYEAVNTRWEKILTK